MKASDFIAEFLESQGVKCVFELSGGMITHILDSFYTRTSIRVVSMHHEQGAAFSAEGYARSTNVPGIALATSGPGATNLLTGIGSCFFDSVPAIFITGQVNRKEQKGGRNIRQLGFQETDIVAMARPITKASFLVDDPNQLPEVLSSAFHLAMSGRPGPVLIDIPMDVQRLPIEIKESSIHKYEKNELGDKRPLLVLKDLVDAIKNAKRPLILAGRGIRASGSMSEFQDFVHTTKIPVITSLLGFDTVNYKDQLRVGFIGSYGNRWANIVFGESDLLIVLGSRLDIRQTGADTAFVENRRIYHIDCEEGEINNRINNCVPIVTDLREFFSEFKKAYSDEKFSFFCDWMDRIHFLKKQWPDTKEIQTKSINPNKLIHAISSKSELASAFLADVGSHQMWVAQSLELQDNQEFHTSGGMGAMGFALPAAIGVSFAHNLSPVVAFIGDGCMQINIQELQTVYRNQIPIKIIILNNRTLGMIRQFQDSYFESRYQSTYWGYTCPDFTLISKAYGIDSLTIESESDIDNACKWLWKDPNKPQLLQVMIDPYTNTYPKIAFGKPLTEMEPFSKPLDMEGT